MRLKRIASHTVDVDLIPHWATVLDVGCRDFDFSQAMANLGAIVHAFDPAPDVLEIASKGIYFHQAAVVGKGLGGPRKIVIAGNGSRLDDDAEFPVMAFELESVHQDLGPFALVKLDCEGSEYGILLTWPGPITRQITVEYHEHTGQGKAVHGEDVYERIAAHLGQWYRLAQDEPMDTLWTLK